MRAIWPTMRSFPLTILLNPLLAVLVSVLPARGEAPLRERIDRIVAASAVGPAAELVGDAEYLRRISLDLTGTIPTADQLRPFLAEESENKRQAAVDRLLESHRFIQHMVNVFDVMLMERRQKKHVEPAAWRTFLSDSIASQKPLNRMFCEILLADGADSAAGGAERFLVDREANQHAVTRDVGRIFFGRDLQCAQCHDHPLIDDYYQSDYYGILAYLSRSYLKKGDDDKMTLAEKTEGEADFTSVFDDSSTKHVAMPKLPDQLPLADAGGSVEGASRRQHLAEQATSADNEAFCRNLANRLWAHMMGRGLVHPVDLAHVENPPTYPRLLDLLADELVTCGFDLRYMLREIGLTQTYQRSIDLPEPLSVADEYQAELAGLEAEHERLETVAKTSSEAVDAAMATVRVGTAEVATVVAARDQAAAAKTAAEKTHEEKLAELEKVKAELAKHESALPPLREAAVKSAEAAALLVDDQTLAQVAATLVERLAQAERDQQAAAEALSAQQTAAEEAAQAIASQLESLQAKSQQLADLQAKVVTLCRLADRTRRHHAQDREHAQHADWRLANMRVLLQYGSQVDETRQLRDRIAVLEPDTPQGRLGLAQLAEEMREATARIEATRGKLIDAWVEQASLAEFKPLSAEQFAWSAMQATGLIDVTRQATGNEWDAQQVAAEKAAGQAAEQEGDENGENKDEPAQAAPPVAREVYIDSQLAEKLSAQVNQFVSLFGGEPGAPPHEFHASVDQALFLSNGEMVRSWLAPQEGNLTGRLVQIEEPRPLAEELYLSVLARMPDEAELEQVSSMLTGQDVDRQAVIVETAWALITSTEFRFNH